VDIIVDPRELELDPMSTATVEQDRSAKVNLDILHEYAARTEQTAPRRIIMRFLGSPMEIIGTNGRITAVKIEHNELVPDSKGGLQAKGTGKFETIEAGLVLRSIGYRSLPVEGVPFNFKSHTINNIAGRVVEPETGEVVPGEYVVGWAKRGPTGLIGNNKPDSAATVDSMLADVETLEGIKDNHRDPSQIEAFLREQGVDYVTYKDWKILDQYEISCGTPHGRPRVKLTTVPEMLEIIRQGR
jgi:ferredoxin/flavodoxin---NADP+ reductase